MTGKRNRLLSAFGTAFEIFKALVHEVLRSGGEEEDLRLLLKDEGLRREVACLIVEAGLPLTENRYKVVVDYDLSPSKMIEAGRYDLHSMRFAFDCFSSSKEENKPKKTGREEKEIVLFRFADPKPLDEVIAELERAGYRPAELEDLLALGATYPNLQRRFPIMALGSIFTSPDGQRWAPCISREGDNRICSLCGLKGGLPHPRWRFAAVPKLA